MPRAPTPAPPPEPAPAPALLLREPPAPAPAPAPAPPSSPSSMSSSLDSRSSVSLRSAGPPGPPSSSTSMPPAPAPAPAPTPPAPTASSSRGGRWPDRYLFFCTRRNLRRWMTASHTRASGSGTRPSGLAPAAAAVFITSDACRHRPVRCSRPATSTRSGSGNVPCRMAIMFSFLAVASHSRNSAAPASVRASSSEVTTHDRARSSAAPTPWTARAGLPLPPLPPPLDALGVLLPASSRRSSSSTALGAVSLSSTSIPPRSGADDAPDSAADAAAAASACACAKLHPNSSVMALDAARAGVTALLPPLLPLLLPEARVRNRMSAADLPASKTTEEKTVATSSSTCVTGSPATHVAASAPASSAPVLSASSPQCSGSAGVVSSDVMSVSASSVGASDRRSRHMDCVLR
mmetsp:Transcript_25337/g.81672  ORF Transcript_25337/g.81672 Transcript_25337/m.81672 type:complete len:407 (-) Transcript_25337:89-1309(-)